MQHVMTFHNVMYYVHVQYYGAPFPSIYTMYDCTMCMHVYPHVYPSPLLPKSEDPIQTLLMRLQLEARLGAKDDKDSFMHL